MRNTTAILNRLKDGDAAAAGQLLPIVYQELRALAGHLFQNEPMHHTLQPTAIVHEAYLRLISVPEGSWTGRAHFLAVAAKAMRQILIDHARRRNAVKRGGQDWNRITLDRALDAVESDTIDATDLDEALSRLAERSERQARIVELRVFGGLTVDEVVEVTGFGRTTINAEWTIAKAWLKRELLGNRTQ
ncbi:MAG: sigma-70 family RNA polymerase sigma factor [Phycisphaerales bacterium]|nr:sigma-70 family RNA polymerase sigma factor [Phycisphaerales bacterium]MCB9864288.1 sigma-70 family RNA polymerase sigma factor [Phycisphaerales bacterium]